MADTGIDAVKKQKNAEYAKQYRMKRKTYKWFGTFIIKDGSYTFFLKLELNQQTAYHILSQKGQYMFTL
jgi:hypothetical protein